MKKSKTLIPILVIVLVFSIYFIGKNVKFENNALRIKHLAGSIDDVIDPNLKSCIEAKNQPITEITSLVCQNMDIHSLEGIDGLTALQTLDLSNNYISDLSPVKDLSSTLTRLYVDKNSLKSFNLANMSKLQRFQASDNYLTEFPVLPRSIEHLIINRNKLTGAVDLAEYPNLYLLGLNGNSITSLNLGSSNIKTLDLNNNNIPSINAVTITGTPIANLNDDNLSLIALTIAKIPWDENVKRLILSNTQLETLSLEDSGITDAKIFKTNAANFANLKDLNLNFNTMSNLDLTSLPALEILHCNRCGLTTLEGIIDKTKIKKMNIPNNNLNSFFANQYPALEIIDISGNKLLSFDANGSNLKELSISHNNLIENQVVPVENGNANLSIFNPTVMEKLTMRNSGLTGNLDFSAFTALKELNLDNVVFGYANNINRITLLGEGPITSINVSNNNNFDGINITGATDENKVLNDLIVLNANFTGMSNISVKPYPKLSELSLIGNNRINSIEWGTDLTKINKLGIALTGININNSVPSLPNLRELSLNANMSNAFDATKYPKLGVIRGVSEGEDYILTSRSAVGFDSIKQAIPSDLVSSPDNERMYKFFTEVDYVKAKTIEPTVTRVHYIAKQAALAKPDQYKGITAYDGYFNTHIIKIASEKYSFDDTNMIMSVGNATDDEILENITLPDGARASIEDGKLVVTVGDNVLGKYTISHTNPVNPGNDDPIVDPTTHNSEDPYNQGASGNYGTTENPNTGAILSIIAVIVLIAAGIVSYYYMQQKKKNEELIEKI